MKCQLSDHISVKKQQACSCLLGSSAVIVGVFDESGKRRVIGPAALGKHDTLSHQDRYQQVILLPCQVTRESPASTLSLGIKGDQTQTLQLGFKPCPVELVVSIPGRLLAQVSFYHSAFFFCTVSYLAIRQVLTQEHRTAATMPVKRQVKNQRQQPQLSNV